MSVPPRAIIVTLVNAPQTFPFGVSSHWLPRRFRVSAKFKKPRSAGLPLSGGCFPTMVPCLQSFPSVNVIKEHGERLVSTFHTQFLKRNSHLPPSQDGPRALSLYTDGFRHLLDALTSWLQKDQGCHDHTGIRTTGPLDNSAYRLL